MAYGSARPIAPAGARTSSGNSGAIPVSELGEFMAIMVDVTSISGVGASIAFSLEWSFDGNVWATADPVDEFATSFTAAGRRIKRVSVKAPVFRLVWTVTGMSPNINFNSGIFI